MRHQMLTLNASTKAAGSYARFFGRPDAMGLRANRRRQQARSYQPAISILEIRTGLVDGFECVDDRFHRVTVVFSENPVGVVLPAFNGIAKDDRGLL